MQAFKDLFSKSSNDAEPSASVLAEWNTYASEEGSGSAPSQRDRLLGDTTRKMEEGAAAVGKFLGTSFKAVSTQVQTGVSGAAASVATGVQSISLPSTTQLVYFAAILGSGLLLLALAFFLFLPVIILAPSKFAMTFSLGSICILSSVGALRGWKEQLQHMISRERLPFTAAYLTSVLGTLYASLVMHSYIFSLLCCAFQIAALLYYLMSYFPGGSTGARFMLGVIGKGITQAFSACTRAILR